MGAPAGPEATGAPAGTGLAISGFTGHSMTAIAAILVIAIAGDVRYLRPTGRTSHPSHSSRMDL